jgi:hypothetical protein
MNKTFTTIELIENVFQNGFKDRYDKIFKQYYPAHDSTGFTERNLTCNYAEALIQTLNDENAFVWYEAPLPRQGENKMKCQHIDAVVFSEKYNSVFFIEAKRLGDRPTNKIQAVIKDLNRLLPINGAEGFEDSENRKHILKEWGWKDKSDYMGDFNQYVICISDFWLNENSSIDQVEVLLTEMKDSFKHRLKNTLLQKINSFDQKSCLKNYSIFIIAFEIFNHKLN